MELIDPGLTGHKWSQYDPVGAIWVSYYLLIVSR